MKNKPERKKLDKKTIIWIVIICILIVVLVVVVCMGQANRNRQKQTKSNLASYVTSDTESQEKAGEFGVINPNNPDNTVTHTEIQTTSFRNSNRMDTDGGYIKKENGKYVWYTWADGAEKPTITRAYGYTGAYYVVISDLSSTPYLYYFKDGVYQPDYSGMTESQSGDLVYIHKGKLDPNYEGLVKYKGTRWYIKNGIIQDNYTGNATINGKVYFIRNGAVD